MVVLLIASALFAVTPAARVSADACLSAADGDWNVGATWTGCTGPGGVPAAADDVMVNHEVAITADQAAGSLTIGEGGVVYFTNPATLTISASSGVFEVNGGLFSPEILDQEGDSTDPRSGGTLAFAAGAQRILTHGAWVDIWDLTKDAGGPGQSLSFDPAAAGEGGVHIINNVTLAGDAADNLVLQSTVPGSQWQIWPEDGYAIQHVAVEDSKNVSLTVPFIQVADGVDTGNNAGWAFGAPAVVLTSDPNPASEYNPVTFTATTTPSAVGGNVTFMNGTAEISDCVDVPVENGIATCVVNDLDEGVYPISAVYSSFGPFVPVTSNVVSQVVGDVVTVTLTSLVNPAAVGNTLTIQASILPANKVGTVEFKDGDDVIPACAAVTISAGKAICQTTLSAGTHAISAEYLQEDAHSNILTQVVKNLSTVTLASSHPMASFGQAVTFTAAVTAPTGASGTVTFKKGNISIPGCVNVALVGGTAACDVSGLMPGKYHFSVVYSGDDTTFGLEPAAIVQNVDLVFIYMPVIRR
jgi:hypothetical protein